MNVRYPHVIENGNGEKLIFKELQKDACGDRLLVENYVITGSGPVMHTHWLQDESLTVIKGKMGYQVQGQPARYATEGETVLFERGVPHRFWNEGKEMLHCKGWIYPANNIVFFYLLFLRHKLNPAKHNLSNLTVHT
jgi:mannose-6-phosphate isomerase-like protein (cupin superfamily)